MSAKKGVKSARHVENAQRRNTVVREERNATAATSARTIFNQNDDLKRSGRLSTNATPGASKVSQSFHTMRNEAYRG